MKYSVRWVESAEEELAAMWLNSRLRHRITSAAGEIDRLLETSPHKKGESRDSGRRILIVSPLGVLFRVIPEKKEVQVLQVWQFEQHSKE